MKHIKYLFCILLVVQSLMSSAANYHLKQYSTKDGLTQQDVVSVVQSKVGHIWIATYDGLNRFDGKRFTSYRHNPNDSMSLVDNRILTLECWDTRDEIWISLEGGGLCNFNLKTENFSTTFLENHNLSTLHQHQGKLWAGGTDSLFCLEFLDDEKVNINSYYLSGNKREEKREIVDISHDGVGNIVVGTDKGVFCKSPNERSFRNVAPRLSVKKILLDLANNLWFVTNDRLLLFSESSQQIKNYFTTPSVILLAGKKYKQFESITAITDRSFIVNTNNELYRMNVVNNRCILEKIQFTNSEFLQNNTIRATFVDKSMNVWISSQYGGTAKFDLNQKQIYQRIIINERQDSHLFIHAITKDQHDRLWLGTNKGCFVSHKNVTTSCLRDSSEVYGLLTDTENNVWCAIGTDILYFPNAQVNKGLSLYALPHFPKTITQKDGPYSICEDTIRNIIWVGLRVGLLQIDKNNLDNLKFKHFDLEMFDVEHLSNMTNILNLPERNSLLITTAHTGIFEARLSSAGEVIKVHRLKSRHTRRTNDYVWSVIKASDGNVYIGTDSGLKRIHEGESGILSMLPIDNSDIRLKTYKITAIQEDHNKTLWLSTGQGLVSYGLEDEDIKLYSQGDGLASSTLTEGSYFDSAEQELYIGGYQGLSIVNLNRLTLNEIPPHTVLENMQINNQLIYVGASFNDRVLLPQSWSYTKEIKLKYNENNLSFYFASLHYSTPNKNEYAYKLEGFNSVWMKNGRQNILTFTNLPSGRYTLLVKSANGDGIWEADPLRLDIYIAPAPWLSIWAFLLYTLFTIIVLVIIYRYYDEKRRSSQKHFIEQFEQQKKLEIAEIKLKYHTNITHELRTPLSLIVSPIQELIDRNFQDPYLSSRLLNIKNNADRLLLLVGQFLDMRKITSDRYDLHVRYQRIDLHIRKIIENFKSLSIHKKVQLQLFYDTGITYCWCDVEIINKICYNLISNAIKYTDEGGVVNVYVSSDADLQNIIFSIEDTGRGIAENELSSIFERFYQSPDSVGGTGIGLHLCKHLTALHHGTIDVKSHVGKGTLFTVTLPIEQEIYINNKLIEEVIMEESIETTVLTNEALVEVEQMKTKERSLVLIVEDNHELRKYLCTTLREEYDIMEAENGKVGLAMAQSRIPNLIISDIMMPIMDGIELLKLTKSHLLTSHIPFILLTAKDTQENEIEGLYDGADDYIIKPFNIQSLKLKIRNLIRLVKRNTQEEEKEAASKFNERDKEFLEEVEEIILKNMSSSEFNIDDICKVMCISRMQIHRKMTALLSIKPSQFIKEIRMKRAFELIKNKGYNITETMYEVGYTNHSHFSKLFNEVNGVSPKELISRCK